MVDLRVQFVTASKVLVQRLGGRVPPGDAAFENWQPSDSDLRVLPRGPMERLVVSETRSSPDLLAELTRSVAGLPLVLTDVSHGFELLRAHGGDSPRALAADIGVSLTDRDFPTGSCARTSFAQASVTLHRLNADTWDIYVERPLARAVHDWLIHNACAEAGS